MQRSDWKGCPFCGRYGYNVHVKVFEQSDGIAWAECCDCHARGPVIHRAQGMGSDELIRLCRGAWNARKSADGLAHKVLSDHAAYKDKIMRRKRGEWGWQSEK